MLKLLGQMDAAEAEPSSSEVFQGSQFDEFFKDFLDFLNVDEMIPYLYRSGQLTRDQCERIVAVPMAVAFPKDRVEYLISILKRKGPKAFHYFVVTLKESVGQTCPCDEGNRYLLNKIILNHNQQSQGGAT